jgi:hypothetical protein
MKTRYLIPIAALCLIAPGCEVRDPVSDEGVVPVLSRASVPDSLRLGDADGIIVSVHVVDPQGASDIDSVFFDAIRNSEPRTGFLGRMTDDGTGPDLLPADGVYSGRIRGPDLAGDPGVYVVFFTAVDHSGNLGHHPFVHEIRTVAGGPLRPPVILSAAAPDTVHPDDRSAVNLRVSVTDPDGQSDVDSVYCDVYPPYATVPAVRIALGPSFGSFATAGADEYDAIADMTALLTGSGIHRFRFCARDRSGLESVPVVLEAAVVLPNDPPRLSEAVVPETVDRNTADPVLLSVRVTDPQGASDIHRVYFNTTKPNGAPSSGNPFLMTDDGTSGDAVAGDGVYSLQIVISSSNALGNYRFDFYAEDNAGAMAGPLTRVITVIDEFPD